VSYRFRTAAAILLVASIGTLVDVAAKKKPTLPKVTGPAVRITVQAEPRVRAEVWWGRILIGTTPLVFERPYDSGPMDLVLRASGYLTVRTRAHPFSNDRLFVRMTRVADRHTVFGFRREPPHDGGVPDAGTP